MVGGDDDTSEDLGSLATVLRQLADDHAPAALVPGAVIDGTYRIDRAVGEGGMGVVYAARDLRLERDVAIKIGSSGSASGLARAGREALALARLSHPNVVVVHQVGELDGRLYLAMELVTGGNARQWIAGGRTWREIVALYAAAGDGLVAAHAAGLIHRDFKPDNVLVGADGRPRVADFGLARDAGDVEPATGGARSASTVTQTGAVVGTPAYMAPEQLAGRELDARADQFAFCASLWEALFGARPFPGKTPAEIADAISGSAPVVPAGERARGVPRHVTVALARGLRVDPDQRWPDMHALVGELRRDLAARRRRIAIAATAAAAIAAIVALASTRGGGEAPCRTDPAWLTGVWDGPRRDALEHGFTASGPGAAATFTRTTERLDAYAARWRDARLEACQATHERHEQSDAALDRRVACLDDMRGQLGAAVDLLSRAPDAALVRHAIDVVGAIDDPAACARVDVQGAEAPPPFDPAARMRLAAVAAEIHQAEALLSAGRAKPALALATDALAQARALDRATLTSRALLQVGSAQDELGDSDAAVRAYDDAARTASVAHDDYLVARAWAEDLFELASRHARLEDAERILPVADAAIARAGNPPALAAMVTNARAKIAFNRGRLDEGLALSETVVTQYAQVFGKDSVQVASGENNVGFALGQHDRFAEALPHFERALAIFEKAYGHDHPAVADELGNIAGVLTQLGRVDDARTRMHDVRDVLARIYGDDSPNLVPVLDNLATLEHTVHHDTEARAAIGRAIAIERKAHGDGSIRVAAALEIEGNIEHAAHDPAAAARDYREAIAIFEKSGGADSAELLGSLVGLGNLGVDAERFDEADAEFTRALAIAKQALGPDAHSTVIIEASLNGTLVGRHRYAEAVAAYPALIARDERVFGADSHYLATDLDNDGTALHALGRDAEARTQTARSLAIREQAYGADDALVGKTLDNLAAIDRALGRRADAAAEAARAKQIAAAAN